LGNSITLNLPCSLGAIYIALLAFVWGITLHHVGSQEAIVGRARNSGDNRDERQEKGEDDVELHGSGRKSGD
jgi:hypothetical protein